MKLPIQIDHSFLRDTIIEIRYIPSIENEIISGYVYSTLVNLGYKLELQRPIIPSNLGLKITGDPIYKDENSTVKFNINSIVFNTHGNYPFWNVYYRKMQYVLRELYRLKLINKVTRVGVRYINVFEDINVYDIVDDSFRIKLPEHKSQNTHVKTELIEDDFKIIVNIGNGFTIQKENKPGSVFDIDVIKEAIDIINREELLKTINTAHQKEKSIFFSTLKDNFIKTLNPKY